MQLLYRVKNSLKKSTGVSHPLFSIFYCLSSSLIPCNNLYCSL